MTAPLFRLSSRFLRCTNPAHPSIFRTSLTSTLTITRINMSTLPHQTGTKTHEALSDISKMKVEEDGSFKRKASTFRNWVQRNGEFAPDKGMIYGSYAFLNENLTVPRSLSPIRLLCLP